jgi:hypothetical protein
MASKSITFRNKINGKLLEIQLPDQVPNDLTLRLPTRNGVLLTRADLTTAIAAFNSNMVTADPILSVATLSQYEGTVATVTISNYDAANTFNIYADTTGIVQVSRTGANIHLTFLPTNIDISCNLVVKMTAPGKLESYKTMVAVTNMNIPEVTDDLLIWQNGIDANLGSGLDEIYTGIALQGDGETDWVMYTDKVEMITGDNIFTADDGVYITVTDPVVNGDDLLVVDTGVVKVGDVVNAVTGAYTGYPCEFSHYDNYWNNNLLKTIDPVNYDNAILTAPINNPSITYFYQDNAPWVNPVSIITSSRIYKFGGYTYEINGVGASVNNSYYKELNPDGSIPSTPWVEDTGVSGLPTGLNGLGLIVLKNTVYLVGGNNFTTASGNYIGGSNNNTIYKAPIDINGHVGTWVSSGVSPNISQPSIVITKNKVYLSGLLISYPSNVITNIRIGFKFDINTDGTLGSFVAITLPNSGITLGSQSKGFLFKTKSRLYLTDGYYAVINSDGSIGAWISQPLGIMAASGSTGLVTLVFNNYVYFLIRDINGGYTKLSRSSIDSNGILGTNIFLGTVAATTFSNLGTLITKWWSNLFIINNTFMLFDEHMSQYLHIPIDGWNSRLNDTTAATSQYKFKKLETLPVLTNTPNTIYLLPKLSVKTAMDIVGTLKTRFIYSVIDTVTPITADAFKINNMFTINFAGYKPINSFRAMQHSVIIKNAVHVVMKITTYLTKRG